MKPIIGIVGRSLLIDGKWTYIGVPDSTRKPILEFGGIPFAILPPQQIDYYTSKMTENPHLEEEEKDILTTILDKCDGIIMPGGNKMYEHDFFILEYAIKKDIPILGYCMGMQVMANFGRQIDNVRNEDNHKNEPYLDYVHKVIIDENSLLYKIVRNKTIKVNSMHSLHVYSSGAYKVTAISEDGLIEGIELPSNTFNIGVQWHPEKMIKYDDYARRIFQRFIDECMKYSQGRKKNMVSFEIN